MKVALDATALLGPRTGVGTFVHELVTELARRPIELTAFSVTWRGRGQLADAVPRNVRTVARPLPARLVRAMWKRLPVPPAEWLVGDVDLVHGPNFVVPPCARAATVVTVHDLSFIHDPELTAPAVHHYPELIQRAIDRGAWVHTDSTFVADEVRARFDVDSDRVVPIHLGVTPPAMAGGDPPPTPLPYVVAVGTVEPRKNLPLLVEAFDRIAADLPDLQLVLAGPDGWGVEQLERALDASPHRLRIHRLGWLDEPTRQRLVREALVLAYPSRYEGFGLPPLEAMASGTAVVASSAGSLPEVIGEAAVLVTPNDVDELAGALRELATDADRRAELVTIGRRRANEFTWSACATGITELYQRAAAEC